MNCIFYFIGLPELIIFLDLCVFTETSAESHSITFVKIGPVNKTTSRNNHVTQRENEN